MKRLRNEKGVITLITVITVLFIVSFLMTSYVLISNKVKTQKEILSETRKIYEPKTTMEEIYNSYFTNDNIIPIYTVEQLLAIGNNEKININGKVYTFSNTENSAYLLKNDLEFSANDLNLENDWIPPYYNEDLLANFDWSGHTIKVTNLNGNVITYDGTYLATTTGNPLILRNSIKGNLLDYKIYGNSVQNGDPSSSTPVEIQSVGDKTNNLLDMSIYKNSVSQNGITVTYLEEEDVIVLNGTAEKTANVASTYINIPITNGSYFSLSTKYISGKVSRPNQSDNAVVFFGAQDNIDSSTNWKNIRLSEEDSKLENAKCNYNYITRIFLYISTGVTFDNYKVKIQLEQGSKATEYEPYGKYKIPIEVTGKNKYFNSSDRDTTSSYGVNIKNKLGNSNFTITGTANTNGALLASVGNILKPGNYKIKMEGDNKLDWYYIQLSTDNSTWTNKLLQLKAGNVYSFTVSETSYSRIGIRIIKDVEYNSNYKILIRDADVNFSDLYEPYRGKTFNIYLDEPLRKVGDYADYIDFETQKVYRKVKVIDNTGTMSIESSYQGQDTPEETEFQLQDISILKGINSIEVDTQVQPSNISVTYKAKQ